MSDVTVDAHMHLFAQLSDDFPRGVHDLYPEDRAAEVDDYLQVAEAAGIDHAVLVSLDDNDGYMRHVCDTYPDRFSAVAVMDAASEDPVGDFRRHMASGPLVGYRIWTLGAGRSLEPDDRHLDLLGVMQEAGVAAWFYSDETQLRALARVAHRYPGLPIILNHLGVCQTGFACDEWGRPKVSTSIPPSAQPIVEGMARTENVAVLFSGHYAFSAQEYPYEDFLGVSDRLLQAFGAARLLWASDWPWIRSMPGYAAIRDLVRIHLPGLNAGEMSQVMGGNAIRILGIETRTGQ